jgi:uncharacterized protein (TIGR03663 family)
MSRAAFGSLILAALVVALAGRLAALDRRPMHHDEANQAVKFGALLETGEYRYDPNDHHGPTLYYLTLPFAWARGQTTLASLDEWTLRAVPACFGAALILFFPLLAPGLGRRAAAAGALLAAISPALTYFSRFYIQESLFVWFALAFLIALGRYVQRPGTAAAVGAGVFAGLAYATKETSVIVLVAALVAAIAAQRWTAAPGAAGQAASRVAYRARAGQTIAGLTAALAIAWVFYSSFFRYPSGLLDSFNALSIYVERGVVPGLHGERWDYYLRLLAFSSSGGLVWSEGLVLLLALVGLGAAFRRSSGFWPRYVALYFVIAAVAFSVIRYKTPWNALPFYAGFVMVAGLGAATLIDRAGSRLGKGIVLVAFLAASCQLGLQNWRANVRYPADPRNPYVYAQTSPDFLRMVTRINDLAALHPDRARMLVKVVAGPYEQWPLPWYLRRMPRVGYWPRADDAGRLDDAAIVVASEENGAAVDAALGDRYVSEFYGLRPDVILTISIERGLWERLLASRRPGT